MTFFSPHLDQGERSEQVNGLSTHIRTPCLFPFSRAGIVGSDGVCRYRDAGKACTFVNLFLLDAVPGRLFRRPPFLGSTPVYLLCLSKKVKSEYGRLQCEDKSFLLDGNPSTNDLPRAEPCQQPHTICNLSGARRVVVILVVEEGGGVE